VEKADGSLLEEHAIALVDEVCLYRIYGCRTYSNHLAQREHLAAVVGIHPIIQSLSAFLPDPFFVNGRKSSTGLIDLARRKVKQRLASGTERNDLLGRLIKARASLDDAIELTPSEVDELTAEAVTLL
jgi:benzoate 4-monooxygenase